MGQEEFLNSFREALIGKVPDSLIRDNENYYRNYINSQINSGKTEEEVLESLGDPRLLAKTIEESNKFAMGEESAAYDQDMNRGTYQTGEEEQPRGTYHKTINLPGWLLTIIGIVVLMLIIVVAFSLISFFAPVILAAIIAAIIFGLVKTWQRRY